VAKRIILIGNFRRKYIPRRNEGIKNCGLERPAVARNSQAQAGCFFSASQIEESRKNIDIILIEDIPQEYIRKVYESFFRVFENIDKFKTAYKETISNCGYLVLDRTYNKVFWYRPKEGREYKIGTDREWLELNGKMKRYD